MSSCIWHAEACGGDQGQHSGSFTEVKARRRRLLLGLVTMHQGISGAVNLGRFVGVDFNLCRPSICCRYHAYTEVK